MPSKSLILEAKVEELGSKCAEYAEKHGEENPDLLIEYGQALFALAKHTSGFVDNQKLDEKHLPLENPKVKVARMDAEIDSDEGEPDSDNNCDNVPQKYSEDAKAASPKDFKGSTTVNNSDKEDVFDQTEPVDGKDGDTEEGNQEKSDQEEDDFMAAFHIVDLARVLLEKQLQQDLHNTSMKTQLSKCRQLLGDISLEDDNAPQAVEDYTEAVKLKRELFGNLSGQVSEAEFTLSLAHDAAGDQVQSLEHLKKAAEAAEAANLNSTSELKQRVEDLEADLKQNAHTNVKQVTSESISGRKAQPSAIQSLISGAKDISQLTRKRKRPEPNEDDAKKE